MRTVAWFSCGAASAVATKLAVAKGPVTIAYTEVIEEHDDNKRFLADCEKWFGQKVDILRNDRYNASIYEVFRKTRYLVGVAGAPCTRLLKRGVREGFQQPGDRQVFGYTAEEQDRLDRFIDANNDVDIWCPLIEAGLTKSDCLAMIQRAGIELPAMYKLGYRNNNCVGCVKGGAGYWNKIRVDFPDVFDRMSKMELELRVKICTAPDQPGSERQRIYLVNLPPDAGRDEKPQDIECSLFCHMAEDTIA
jgi:hypothetical protein